MKVPRYWQRERVERLQSDGTSVSAFGWGFSETNNLEARQRARESAERTTDWPGSHEQTEPPNHYGYDERLPREEIVREFTDSAGQTNAFVSRNGYGSLILNTRDLVFIDVDLPPSPPSGPIGLIASLFGFGSNKAAGPSVEEETLARITHIATRFPQFAFRVYRTANGYRVMATNEPVMSDSDIAQRMLAEFEADPLYVRMCRNQECFRARLTPKSWRCDVRRPPSRYPFSSADAEREYRRWETEYNDGLRTFSTCQLATTTGPPTIHPERTVLIALHDRLTGVDNDDPLA